MNKFKKYFYLFFICFCFLLAVLFTLTGLHFYLYYNTVNFPSTVIWKLEEYEHNPSLFYHKTDLIVTARQQYTTSKTYFHRFYSEIVTRLFPWLLFEKIVIYQKNFKEKRVLDFQHRYEDARIYYYKDTEYILVTDYDLKQQIVIVNGTQNRKLTNSSEKFKNWNFFEDKSGELLLLTDINPFTIRKTNFDGKVEIVVRHPPDYRLENLRCTSKPIPFGKDELLTIAHNKTPLRSIASYFVAFRNEYPFNVTRVSHEIRFFGTFVEFCSGLERVGDQIYVGIGVNDYSGFVLEIQEADILKSFSSYEL